MRTRYLVVAIAVGSSRWASQCPHRHTPPGDSTATVTVTDGSLSITMPIAAGNLGTKANNVLGEAISGPLGQILVNDARSAAAGSGWVASVLSRAIRNRPGSTEGAGLLATVIILLIAFGSVIAIARVQEFDRFAAAQGISSAGLALAWVAHHPQVTAPIIGVSTPAQWQGLHEALEVDWTDSLATQIDELFRLPA